MAISSREQLKNRDFEEIDFVELPPAQAIRYLKSFYKANLDINKPLRLNFIFLLCKRLLYEPVAYLYYSIKSHIRKGFPIGVEIKIIFLSLCKQRMKKVVVNKKNSDFK